MPLSEDEKRARKIDREIAASARLANRPETRERSRMSEDERRRRQLEAKRQWRARNPERSKFDKRKQRERDRERLNAYLREWRARKRAETLDAECAAKRDAKRAYKKAWRRANAERELARGREEAKRFRATNPESVRASQRKWNSANMEYKRQHDRDRYLANPEKFKAKARAKKTSASRSSR